MLPTKRTLMLALLLPVTLATLIGAAPTTGSPATGTDRHGPKPTIVLVGHSYGGAVISGAAVGDSRVKALVHIAAFTPDKGESAAQPAAKFPGSTLGETVNPQSLDEKAGGAAWKTIPSWALIATADKNIPPAAEGWMARRAGSHTTEVDASHAVAVSRPAVVTDVILDAARATR
ncbi:alpha/beta fold hydrolase [Streptomyces sp. NPDC056747]|uniref:alpha/beta fold hydrolase n=1 Tax=Streptomyces sp. NPDC056747 TaxID=3345935 RepID=UPI0036B37883